MANGKRDPLDGVALALSGGGRRGRSLDELFDRNRFIRENPLARSGAGLRELSRSSANVIPATRSGAIARLITGLGGAALQGEGRRQGREDFRNFSDTAALGLNPEVNNLLAVERRKAANKAAVEATAAEAKDLRSKSLRKNPQTGAIEVDRERAEAIGKAKALEKEQQFEIDSRIQAAGRTQEAKARPGESVASRMLLEADINAGKSIRRAADILTLLESPELNQQENIAMAILRDVYQGINPDSIEGRLKRAQDKAVFASLKPLFPGQISDQERKALQQAFANRPNMTISGIRQVYKDIIRESANSFNDTLAPTQRQGFSVGTNVTARSNDPGHNVFALGKGSQKPIARLYNDPAALEKDFETWSEANPDAFRKWKLEQARGAK